MFERASLCAKSFFNHLYMQCQKCLVYTWSKAGTTTEMPAPVQMTMGLL